MEGTIIMKYKVGTKFINNLNGFKAIIDHIEKNEYKIAYEKQDFFTTIKGPYWENNLYTFNEAQMDMMIRDGFIKVINKNNN